jgi:hypothetical protein
VLGEFTAWKHNKENIKFFQSESGSATFCRSWFQEETKDPAREKKLGKVMSRLPCPPTEASARSSPCFASKLKNEVMNSLKASLDSFHPGAKTCFRSVEVRNSGLKTPPAVQW